MVRTSLSWRLHETAYRPGCCDGRGSRQYPFHYKSLYRIEIGLGLRCDTDGLHPFLHFVDGFPENGMDQRADDHSGKQLYAVGGQFLRLFHGQYTGLGVCRAGDDPWRDDEYRSAAVLGLLHGGAGCDDGHPDEAPDDQCGAAAVPHRYRGGRNTERAAFLRW